MSTHVLNQKNQFLLRAESINSTYWNLKFLHFSRLEFFCQLVARKFFSITHQFVLDTRQDRLFGIFLVYFKAAIKLHNWKMACCCCTLRQCGLILGYLWLAIYTLSVLREIIEINSTNTKDKDSFDLDSYFDDDLNSVASKVFSGINIVVSVIGIITAIFLIIGIEKVSFIS